MDEAGSREAAKKEISSDLAQYVLFSV